MELVRTVVRNATLSLVRDRQLDPHPDPDEGLPKTGLDQHPGTSPRLLREELLPHRTTGGETCDDVRGEVCGVFGRVGGGGHVEEEQEGLTCGEG